MIGLLDIESAAKGEVKGLKEAMEKEEARVLEMRTKNTATATEGAGSEGA